MSSSFHSLRKTFLLSELSYANVLFTGEAKMGALLLLTTFLNPWQGATGLAGILLTLWIANKTGFDCFSVSSGQLLFNSLLSSLALAYWLPFGSVSLMIYVALLCFICAATLGVTLVLNHCTITLTGIPALSLPFCATSTALHWIIVQTGLTFHLPGSHSSLFTLELPAHVTLWLESLGSIFFLPHIDAGIFIAVIVLLTTRLNFLYAIVGFAVSMGVMRGTGYSVNESAWLHLNCILCAMALGGTFFVPSRYSLLVAVVGSAFCALIGIASIHFLQLLDIPVLTLPFNITVIGIVAALRWRISRTHPTSVSIPGSTPEATFRIAQLTEARFPDSDLPTLAPPFDGEWIVTQGFEGKLTHRGAWQHALDFEVADSTHKPARPKSSELKDFPSFEAPIVAPSDGKIISIIDDVADNPIGENNLSDNWGNSILMELSPGLYVQLSHFRRQGIRVREGDRVRRGQLLGYLGNSGRSPLPHLHLQMQTIPEIGAPTIPFRFHGYRTPAESSRWFYHFRGLPLENQPLAGCRKTRWMEDCFNYPDERDHQYRVFTAAGEDEETLHFLTNPDGSPHLYSSKYSSHLHLKIYNHHLIPWDYKGPRNGILFLLWQAGRIPLFPIGGLTWNETVSTNPGSGFQKAWGDLLAPFTQSKLPELSGEILDYDNATKQFTIRCHFHSRSSKESLQILELCFDNQLLLVSGRIETSKSWMRFITSKSPDLPYGIFPISEREESRCLV
ncbi:MAG: urea transporter [Chthoniobacterales bacterium]